jgi:lysyl-tRNA synthetase class 2
LERRAIAAARGRLYQLVRDELVRRGYLEVETPCLLPAPGLEPHITAFEASYRPELPGLGPRTVYLATSPEYAMKRLLADGFGHVFQICKAFRNGETAAQHNPEFTMLELYRSPGTVEELLLDLEGLVRSAGRALGCAAPGLDLERPFERLTVTNAWARHFAGKGPPADETQFFREMLETIEPSLGRERPTFLTEYPSAHAALARLKPGDPTVSERFELYARGLELANGFGELNDAAEQRRRFEAEQAQRRAAGRPVYPIDERFLAAVGKMPPSAGVAVGLDRLLMLLLGIDEIEDVLLFPALREWA